MIDRKAKRPHLRNAYSIAQLRWRSTLLGLVIVAVAAPLIAFAVMLAYLVAGTGAMPMALAIVAGLAWMAAISWSARAERYGEIDGSECDGLMQMLEKRPELMGYRQQVLDMARRFTRADLAVVKAYERRLTEWEQAPITKDKEEEACRRLYGMPDTGAGA